MRWPRISRGSTIRSAPRFVRRGLGRPGRDVDQRRRRDAAVGDLRRDLLVQDGVVDPVGADRHDQGGRVGQHAELGELELAVGGQREDRQRAQPEQPEHGLQVLGDVRQGDHHPVARGDPAGREPRGGRPHALAQFSVGPALRVSGGALPDGGEVAGEGLAGPVAGRAVPDADVLGPTPDRCQG